MGSEGEPEWKTWAPASSVAAGYCATESLRNGGVPIDVPPAERSVVRYFSGPDSG